MLLKFEMTEKLDIFEAISHILLPDGSETDFENGGATYWNDLDPNYIISILIWMYLIFQPKQ